MPWKKKHAAESKLASNSELRDCFRRKLQFAVDRIGSVNRASAIIGVNRTQFSRYLSGQSMPRPDMLYRLSHSLSLPMEWFFDTRPDDLETLAVHQFGTCLRDSLLDHRFRISDQELPNGFYISWKRTFSAGMPYEMLLAFVSNLNGVKQMRVGSQWKRPEPANSSEIKLRDRHYQFLVQRSSNGMHMSAGIGDENRVTTTYMRGTATNWNSQHKMMFSGFSCSGAFGNIAGQSVVPILFAHIEDASMEKILPIARRVGGYSESETPDDIRDHLDRINVPEFNILV